ncbi:MAG: hypothetical protein M1832_004902 [Thelocarpon impressellum]|nr:MAG: hypothetical protein M1832_004902 [Thelocarpon impressellum]
MALPSFDDKALASLTKKIELGLDKKKTHTESKARKDGQNGPKPGPAPKATRPAKNEAGKDVAKPEATTQGRKRDHRGDVKKQSRPRHSEQPAKRVHQARESEPPSDDKMLQEIVELGGDSEDLALLAGIDSASEMETGADQERVKPSKADKQLRKDISTFVKGLGIDGKALAEMDSDGDAPHEPAKPNARVKDTPKQPAAKVQAAIQPPASKGAPQNRASQRLMFEPRPDWYTAELPMLAEDAETRSSPSSDLLGTVQEHALSLLATENEAYSSSNLSSSSSSRFLSTIMSSGTLSDRISALTLVVQESPLHTMKAFDNLLGLARKRSRGQAVAALGALKDLLGQGVVLPPDRKLRAFGHQPALVAALQKVKGSRWKVGDPLPNQVTDLHLVMWAYEDWLKTKFFEMIKILEGWCNDEIEFARVRAVQYVWELLKEKPEQEANLLRLLINKLGDPDKKIASKTSFLLLQLQTTHPMMKSIIISSIESDLLFRAGQGSHAKYYAIITLNQTVLSEKEGAVARKLLDIYFGLFVTLLKPVTEKNPSEDAPVAKLNTQGLVQGGGGKAGKKARRKAELEEAAKKSDEELNEKMIAAVLTGVNRAFPFAKTDETTFESHMDTLFKITHSSNFNTSIQALLLIQQLTAIKQMSSDRFYRTLYESLLDPRLLTSSKQAMYLNLLFRSLKADVNAKRVQAFVKRLLQVIAQHQPPFVCGAIYLIKELEIEFPSIRASIKQPEDHEDDGLESFRDAPADSESESRQAAGEVSLQPAMDRPNQARMYDGRKRDPEHSNADKSCLWELVPFLAHFHPSVSLFASRLLQGEGMPAKPDLSLHTLIHFLDRFVYRNAKSMSGPRGSSVMQPLAGEDNSGMLLSSRNSSKARAPLNSEGFWSRKAEDVSVDEVFFHKYFNQVGKGAAAAAAKKKRKSQRGEGSEGDEDDEQEDEIWKALVNSRPELEGGDEGDSDLDGDLDMESGDSDDDAGVDIEGIEDDEDNGKNVARAGDDPSGSEDDELELGGDEEGALFDSEEDVPSDLDTAFRKELEASEVLPTTRQEAKGKKRRKLKHLPTFASVDDYAEMLAGDEEM